MGTIKPLLKRVLVSLGLETGRSRKFRACEKEADYHRAVHRSHDKRAWWKQAGIIKIAAEKSGLI
jgi:hypothetical protein